MSSYVQKALLPDERVIYAAHLHWVVYAQGLVFTVFGGVVGYKIPFILYYFFGADTQHEMTRPLAFVALGIVLIGIIMMLGAYIRQASTELVITNRRVIAKYGFVSRNTYEIMLGRVTGANFDQTVPGRMLGYGTLLVRGAGSDISPIDHVADPQMFHNQLMGVIERVQNLHTAE